MEPVYVPSAALVAQVSVLPALVATRALPLMALGVPPDTSITACTCQSVALAKVAVATPLATTTLVGAAAPQPVTSNASSAAIRHPGVLPLMTGAPRIVSRIQLTE